MKWRNRRRGVISKMSETLIIKNFGPIKDVELELKKFNVIIGEQATGKSTIAKLLSVCRYFSYIVSNQGVFTYPVEDHFVQGLISWGLDEALQPESYIHYKSRHYTLIAKYHNLKTSGHDEDGNEFEYEDEIFMPELSDFSPEFERLLSELNKIKPKSETGSYGFSEVLWTIPTSFFQNEVASVMDNPFYLPTERGLQSIFSLGKNSIPNINDSLFNQLAKLDQIGRFFSKETEIEPLRITYKNVTGRGYVKKSYETEYYSLANGASGYQAAIPIILTLKYYNEIKRRPKTFLIEEPELNLFPTTQKQLVNYLVENTVNFKHTILLTTHSPYILTSLNNLMYAYEVGISLPDDVAKIIEMKYWINPDEVCAYRLMGDGSGKNILSKSEDGVLIAAEEIDEVSRGLNSEFDELIRLEIENKEKNEIG